MLNRLFELIPGCVIGVNICFAHHGAWQVSSVSRSSAIAFYTSVAAIIIANVLFYYALRNREAHTVGCYSYLDPLLTVLGAWFILAERPAPAFVVGAALIVVGLYFTEMHKKHRRHLGLRPKN